MAIHVEHVEGEQFDRPGLEEATIAQQDLKQIEATLLNIVRLGLRALDSLSRDAGSPVGVSLTASAFPILRELEDGPLRLSCLTDSITRHVQNLERKGLVARSRDETDGRGTILDLSDKGRQVCATISTLREAEMQNLLADWTEADIAVLARLLSRLEHGLERQSFLTSSSHATARQ
jgi:DNA-binding MarR family transcriptional regulator